jgi:3-methyladenine DNA glycosylase Tag
MTCGRYEEGELFLATDFNSILRRAEQRKGGSEALRALLRPVADVAVLTATPDDRFLAEMTRRIFCAGFIWSVIEAKWPGFEAAFEGFDVARLAFEPDEFWENVASDGRIVRHGAKIAAVRANANFISRVSRDKDGFGRFLAGWPPDDQIGLLAFLGKNGARLGGMTGQYFLRNVGWDGFILSRDVLAALREAGVELSKKAASKPDLARAQAVFNLWRNETGLPYIHLSRICAMAAGENHSAETILARIDAKTLGEEK